MHPVHTAMIAVMALTHCTAPAAAQTSLAPSPTIRDAEPGCSVGVSVGGMERFESWGLADLEQSAPLTPDTPFHAASLAKQFTAYAVGRLAAQGQLDLDDDVRRYIPELPVYEQPITIRHLVHHTSGLRDQGALLFLAGWRSDDRVTRQDALEAIYRQKGLNFLPGDQDLYNNSGYSLLAEIVARVTGQSLAEYARTMIFEPLGLSHTRFYDDPSAVVPGRARAYRQTAAGWRSTEPNMEVYGASNLRTTVKDLLVWQRHLSSPPPEHAETVTWMRTSGTLLDGTPTGYGGGLYLTPRRDRETFGHDGLDGGYRARTLALPSEGLAIAVLCNSATANPEALVEAVLDEHLPMAPPLAATDTLTPDLAIDGLYWSPENDSVIELYRDADGLARRNPPGRFQVAGDGLYRVGAERWRYEPAAAGRPPRLLALYDPLPPRTYERVTTPAPTDASAPDLAGTYRSEELATTYQVALDEGDLTIRWPRNAPVRLSPAGPDRYFSPSLGTVTFQRNAAGEAIGLTLSLRRVWRIGAVRIPTADD